MECYNVELIIVLFLIIINGVITGYPIINPVEEFQQCMGECTVFYGFEYNFCVRYCMNYIDYV